MTIEQEVEVLSTLIEEKVLFLLDNSRDKRMLLRNLIHRTGKDLNLEGEDSSETYIRLVLFKLLNQGCLDMDKNNCIVLTCCKY